MRYLWLHFNNLLDCGVSDSLWSVREQATHPLEDGFRGNVPAIRLSETILVDFEVAIRHLSHLTTVLVTIVHGLWGRLGGSL